MDTGVVLQQMIVILLLIFTGYLLCKKRIVTEVSSPAISSLVVNVCNPANILASSLDRDPSITNRMVLFSCIAALVMYGCLIAAAFLFSGFFEKEQPWKNHYKLMFIFGNTGFLGIPLVSAVLGSHSLIYVAVVNVCFNLIFYTYGIFLTSDGKGKFDLKKMLNVGNICMILTIVIFCLKLDMPVIFTKTVTTMANATTFLAMIVIGISMAHQDLKTIFNQPKLYVFAGLRYVLLPILISLVIRTFIHDDLMYGVIVLLTAVPAASLPLMSVEENGGDGHLLSQIIVLSTLLSVVTIPIVVYFM